MFFCVQVSPGGGCIEDVSSSSSADEAIETAESASSMMLTRSSKSLGRRGRPLPLPHPFFNLKPQEMWSLPDYVRICTPPSSPELDPELDERGEGDGLAGRLKAGDWIKQV